MQPRVFPIEPLSSYVLIDSGGGEKLERFGSKILRRPDPQALWRKRLNPSVWQGADLSFVRESDRGGVWQDRRGKPMAEGTRWLCDWFGGQFWIQPTPFKHVGAFPEQASNWRVILDYKNRLSTSSPALLNVFGYSGVASVIAASAGYAVTHVDASKTAIQWLRDNCEASRLPESRVRWILDDALAFIQREVRRGSRYSVVLLDPPHYGRGPKGQKWQLETGLAPLLEAAQALLHDQGLLVLSTYAVGHSPLAFANMLRDFGTGRVEAGELALAEEGCDRLLPAGFCARLWKGETE